jgi:hypothetical protein
MAPAFGTPAFRTSLGAVHLLWEAASVAAHTSWEAVSIDLGLIDIKASAQVRALAPRAAVPTIRTLLASDMSARRRAVRRRAYRKAAGEYPRPLSGHTLATAALHIPPALAINACAAFAALAPWGPERRSSESRWSPIVASRLRISCAHGAGGNAVRPIGTSARSVISSTRSKRRSHDRLLDEAI